MLDVVEQKIEVINPNNPKKITWKIKIILPGIGKEYKIMEDIITADDEYNTCKFSKTIIVFNKNSWKRSNI